MMKATMKKATSFLLGMLVVMGFSGAVNAQEQTNPSFEDGKFIFFIDGANVQIPTVDGSIIADPTDPTSGNRVFRMEYADFSEKGFKWPTGGPEGTVGINASAATGTNYGESDTLYVRLWSDSLNFGKADFIGFFDTENGNLIGEDISFRMRWYIPDWARNEEWHTFAIPLPPSTYAQLDSAKAGKNFDGTPLEVEVDSLFDLWAYAGAWANGSAAGIFDGPVNPDFQEWQWNSVKTFGRHVDHNTGGGDLIIDYMSIGVPPSELVDAAPAPVASLTADNVGGVNKLSWPSSPDAGGYKLYFSENEITDPSADGVLLLATKAFDDDLSFDHTLLAPHPDLAKNFQAYYAVTSASNFGSESAPASFSVTSDISASPYYAVELPTSAIDAIFDATAANVIPTAEEIASYFPSTYVPFEINSERKIIENGQGGDDDADISAKVWVGYGGGTNELLVYTEITDDIKKFATPAIATGDAWAYDSWEMGLGNYSPESFIVSSTHTSFQRGAAPDYQFRAGLRTSVTEAFVHESNVYNAVIPFSVNVGDTNATGYRMLTFIDTYQLSQTVDADAEFVFPASDEVVTYPWNIAINDRDDDLGRDTQVSWSNRAGGDTWWNNPTRWQTIAFVGLDKVPSGISNENEVTDVRSFKLDQNYPNPFNPTTSISFTIANSSDVTLEVFNMLGQKVATLLQGEKMAAGDYNQKFDASSLASGMYVYRLSTPSFVQSRKMMLIK